MPTEYPTQDKTFNIQNIELAKKIKHISLKIREEARREIILSDSCNHKSGLIFKKSINGMVEAVVVKRGQFFTTYEKLMKEFGCSKDQVRYQIKKWQEKGVIKIENVTDSKNFDIGLLITYNWLFNRKKQQVKKKNLKIPTREKSSKCDKQGNRKSHSKEIPTPNKEVLSKDNIQRKTTKKEIKKVVFSFKNDFEFNSTAEKLQKLGFNDHRIEKFYKTESREILDQYLKLFELNREKIKNACAWFTQALKQKFSLTQVETWKKQQQEAEKYEKMRQQAEEEERIRQEEDLRKQAEKNKRIASWRQEHGEKVENDLYMQVFEEMEVKNHIIHCYLLKQKKQDQDMLEALKNNGFVRAEVNSRIWKMVKNSNGENQKNELDFAPFSDPKVNPEDLPEIVKNSGDILKQVTEDALKRVKICKQGEKIGVTLEAYKERFGVKQRV